MLRALGKLHDQQVLLGEGEAIFIEHFLGGIGIGADQADQGGVGRILD